MTPTTHAQHTSRILLRDVLKQVSRSFYLTLIVVPGRVRDQMGVAYLFARTADTIADTDLIDRGRRLECLNQFRDQFTGEHVHWDAVRGIQATLTPHQSESGERALLERLEDCFRLYLEFLPGDRERIRQLMTTLTNGMVMDLTVFPGDSAHEVTALKTMADLDTYIYYVAGCVGEFWTEMMCAHLPSLARWDKHEMAKIGIRFGKGLQLTNVLKDVARDLQRGRCYLPATLLGEAKLEPKDLLQKEKLASLKPILRILIASARGHLDQGWRYTMAVPRREVRLRLACMWPILFAGETLQLVSASPDLLDPTVNVKMTRGHVYRLMALTSLTGACGVLWTAYWGRLRKML